MPVAAPAEYAPRVNERAPLHPGQPARLRELGYDKLDAAIAQANELPYAFQAAVFTERTHIADRCIEALAASSVLVNDHTAFRVDWMPFAGRRQSGLGTGGIGYTMAHMSQEKMVVMNRPPRSGRQH